MSFFEVLVAPFLFYENKFYSGIKCFQNIFMPMSETEKMLIKCADPHSPPPRPAPPRPVQVK